MLKDIIFLENSSIKYEYLNYIENQEYLVIENNNLISQYSKNIEEKSLRIVKNEKVSLSYGSGNINIEKLVSNCFDILRNSQVLKKDFYYDYSIDDENIYERKNKIYNPDKLFETGISLSNSIYLRLQKKFKIDVYCWLDNTEVHIRNYRNLNKRFKDQISYFFIRASEYSTNNTYGFAINNDENIEVIDEFVKHMEITTIKNNIGNGNKHHVLLHPRMLRNLVAPIWKDFNRAIIKKDLNLINKFDNLSSKFNLKVSSNNQSVNSYSPFDHEGAFTKEISIVNKGCLDTNISKQDYINTSGLMFKKDHFTYKFKISDHPSLFPSSFIVGKGYVNSSDLIKNIKDGIFIVDSPNIWQNIDNLGNMKGTIGLGFRILNGKLVGSISGFNFSLNVYDILGKNLIEISEDRHLVCESSDILPYVFSQDVYIV